MPTKRKKRILVVEDHFSMRHTLRRFLEDWGYEVAEGIHGEQGLAHVRQMVVDLVVTDWQMPKLDGIEMVRLIRADNSLKRVPVVMLTGSGMTRKAEALVAGVNVYITKDDKDKFDTLKKAIEDLLSSATP